MEIRINAQSGGKLPAGNMLTAVQNALKATMAAAKKDAAEKIESRYVRPEIGTKKLKVSVRGLKGVLKSSGSRNPLEKFEVNPKRRQKKAPPKGIFARVLRSGGGYIGKGFFKKSGGIFERTGAARFPIRRLKSVSAPGMLKVEPVTSYILSKLEKNFAEKLSSEVAKML